MPKARKMKVRTVGPKGPVGSKRPRRASATILRSTAPIAPGDAAAPAAPEPAAAESQLEERVVAFAEHLGRVVGTVQARTEGWLDPQALKQEMASIRDGAADVLDHI